MAAVGVAKGRSKEGSGVIQPKISFSKVGVSEKQGLRPSMEDAAAVHTILKPNPKLNNPAGLVRTHSISYLAVDNQDRVLSFFGVFDGHGGSASADFVSETLPQLISSASSLLKNPSQTLAAEFVRCDRLLKDHLELEPSDYPGLRSGCTAVTTLIDYDPIQNTGKIFCANLGDSRCVLVKKNGTCMALSRDHVPNDPEERARIEENGGDVKPARPSSELLRVLGVLSVTRSFGDFQFKMPAVSELSRADKQITGDLILSEPEIMNTDIDFKEDLCLILACDGVWNSFSNEEAAQFVSQKLKSYKSRIKSQQNDVYRCQKAAEELVDCSISRGSTDNCTALILLLEPFVEKSNSQSSTCMIL